MCRRSSPTIDGPDEPHEDRQEGGDRDEHEGLGVDGATAIVVATQGHYDDLALAAALDTDAGYIGLVASHRRAEVVLDHLRSRGVSDENRARVRAPAGIDLGRVSNAEIAVAVLADLVQRRARGELAAVGSAREARVEAIDPVCGMTVLVDDAKYHSVVDGVDFWFCAPGCQRAFESDPGSFAAT